MNDLEKELIKILYLSKVFIDINENETYIIELKTTVKYFYYLKVFNSLTIETNNNSFEFEYLYKKLNEYENYPEDFIKLLLGEIRLSYTSTEGYIFNMDSTFNIIKKIVINYFKGMDIKALAGQHSILHIKLYKKDLIDLILNNE